MAGWGRCGGFGTTNAFQFTKPPLVIIVAFPDADNLPAVPLDVALDALYVRVFIGDILLEARWNPLAALVVFFDLPAQGLPAGFRLGQSFLEPTDGLLGQGDVAFTCIVDFLLLRVSL